MGKKLPYKPRKRFYDAEKIAWIQEHINDDCTVEELAEIFSARFRHKVNRNAFNKAINLYCGAKPRPKTIHQPSINSIGTVIADKDGKKCRVKTENGYAQANSYFKKLYGIPDDMYIIHLNGDYTDFQREHIEFADKSVYASLTVRKWIFPDIERTKAAILLAELILLLPAIAHNENQFLKMKAIRCD